jgi:hypothetical protein
VIRPAWLAAAALGLALRLLFSLVYWTGQPLTRDEREYLSLARSLAAGQGFTYDAGNTTGPSDPFGRAPGYPAFLAAVGGGARIVEHVPAAVRWRSPSWARSACPLAGVLADRLAGARASTIAACIAAVYPPLVWIAAYAYSEALIWLLGLGRSGSSTAPRSGRLTGGAAGRQGSPASRS